MSPPELSELTPELVRLRVVERKQKQGELWISQKSGGKKKLRMLYLIKRVSRSWSRATKDFMVR